MRVELEEARQLMAPVADAVGVGAVVLVVTLTMEVLLQPLAGFVTVKV